MANTKDWERTTTEADGRAPEPPMCTFVEPIALVAITSRTSQRSRPSTIKDTDVKDAEIAEVEVEVESDSYPDGGRRAWLVVVGGMCAAMGAFGLVASVGAFQSYYEQHLLSGYSSSQIAWIGSVQTAVCFSICLFTGPLFDRYGPRRLLVTGTLLLVFGFCMLSLAREYYAVFLCHAGPIALGMDLVFLVPMSAVGGWFYRRRGLALCVWLLVFADGSGILMTGSSVGAIVWPLLIAHLPQRIGWGWTMRVMALALGVLGLIASVLVKVRLPPGPRGPFFHLEEFRNMGYTCVSLSYPANSFGFFSFITFIGTYGAMVGLGSFAPYLLMINNAASGVGRIVGGVAADRLGVFNVSVFACLGMAVLIFAWMGMNTAGALVALCIIYGFLSGMPVSLQAPMLMAVISDQNLLGTLIGQSLILESVASVVAAPLFGLIVGTGTAEEKLVNFKYAIAFGGSMLALSALLLIPARVKVSRKWWAVA